MSNTVYKFVFIQLCAVFLVQGQAAERESTATPFAKGDIIVAATVMDDPDDDHAGTGRLLQYDADLNLKGTIWVEGTGHKIGGLAFGPYGMLWGFAQLTPAVLQFGLSPQAPRTAAWLTAAAAVVPPCYLYICRLSLYMYTYIIFTFIYIYVYIYI